MVMSVAAIYRIARVGGEYSKRYSVASQVEAASTNLLLPLVTVSYRCRHLSDSPRMRRIAALAATQPFVCTARAAVALHPASFHYAVASRLLRTHP